MEKTRKFRQIPSVDRVLSLVGEAPGERPVERANRVAAIREAVEDLRRRMRGGEPVEPAECTPEAVARAAMARARDRLSGTLRPVINLTGVILHTNLGRAPLAPEWLDEVRDGVSGYCNLEYDIAGRRRGARDDHLDAMLRRVVPAAEAGLVVNNCAAAVLLALTALARGREVVVSRGELVEIGGGFRVPEVMASSGARLVEVGTTNRTRRKDYEAAIGPETAMLFKAHPSNFRMVGFVEEVGVAAMAEMAHRHGLPAVVDLGSGLVSSPGVPAADGEPGPQQVLEAGADVVCVSGDKLLGGCQAGIVLGREAFLLPMRRHPLMRALRVDKLVIGTLQAVLRRHLAGDLDGIPVLAAMRLPAATVRRRCESLVRRVRRAGTPDALGLQIVPARSEAGGGTLPASPIPSFGVAVRLAGVPEDEVDARLRACDPPILGRVQDGAVLLDLRTLLPGQMDAVVRALAGLPSLRAPATPAIPSKEASPEDALPEAGGDPG